MKQKLAIIGANASITHLIKRAKAMGYETHAFAWQCGDPGEKEADFFYPISIDKKEEILEKCRELGISGICSITSDYASPTVNFVARKLGLVCNPEESETLTRDKYEMRCALRDAGVYTPRFVKTSGDFTPDMVEGFHYPLIVKPTDRWSGKGITRIENESEIVPAIQRALEESFDKQVIIEEFMDGEEYSTQCICLNGEYHILSFIRSCITGNPYCILHEHFVPSGLSEEKKKECEFVFKKALQALKIRNGAAHIQYKILSDGTIGIIEIGARMGGDCLGIYLTPMDTGLDFIEMVINVACGKPVSFEKTMEMRQAKVQYIVNASEYADFIKYKQQGDVIAYGEIDTDFKPDDLAKSIRHGFYIINK